MTTFPSINYLREGYSYSYEPAVIRMQYHSNNTRQRQLFKKRDQVFNVKLYVDNSDLSTFETFVSDSIDRGADTYTGPYFTSDAEYTGTLEMLDGEYKVEYIKPDAWFVSFSFELKERGFTEEQKIYETVNALSGFSNYYYIVQATEKAVNDNNL